jgi:aminodeoxychorismate lyase
MIVFLNGQFVPAERAVVSVFDRSFLYGDGLFETMLVANGRPFRWTQHLERLQRGADYLNIKLPYSREALRSFASELILKNQIPEGLLRLTLSRGVGVRGYSPKGADNPALVMSLHPVPQPVTMPEWKLIASSVRLPANEPLAQFKTCNKLPQIFARAEADAAGADEALLLNTDGFVVEGASSNLFWIEGQTVCTPPLQAGILAGVTRELVVEICRSLAMKFSERNITVPELKQTQAVFVSLSSWGIVGAQSLDGCRLNKSPVIQRLEVAYSKLVQAETQ